MRIETETTDVDLTQLQARALREKITSIQFQADSFATNFEEIRKRFPDFSQLSYLMRGRVKAVSNPSDHREITFLLPRRGRAGLAIARFANNSYGPDRSLVEVQAFEDYGHEHITIRPVQFGPKIEDVRARVIIDDLRNFIQRPELNGEVQIQRRTRNSSEKPEWQLVKHFLITSR